MPTPIIRRLADAAIPLLVRTLDSALRVAAGYEISDLEKHERIERARQRAREKRRR